MSSPPDDPLVSLQRQVEHLFRNLVYQRHPDTHFRETAWTPPTDLVVSESLARVIVELAGVPREDVQVKLHGHLLEIRGRRGHPPQVADGTHYHHAEIYFGEFRRTIELPWVADEDQVTAQYRDGMLEIHLVPSPVTRTTEITVESGEP